MSLLFEEIWISPKLEVCGENEVDIRNQRPRVRRKRLILGRKAGGGGCKGVPQNLHEILSPPPKKMFKPLYKFWNILIPGRAGNSGPFDTSNKLTYVVIENGIQLGTRKRFSREHPMHRPVLNIV